jgi:hypothetical protein
VKLIAACGMLDIDDPQPAITVMMPEIDAGERGHLACRARRLAGYFPYNFLRLTPSQRHVSLRAVRPPKNNYEN